MGKQCIALYSQCITTAANLRAFLCLPGLPSLYFSALPRKNVDIHAHYAYNINVALFAIVAELAYAHV